MPVSYSFDGKAILKILMINLQQKGRWIGAKAGLFCAGESQTNDSGFADFDWFRVDALPK